MRNRPRKTSARLLLFLVEVFQPVFWIMGLVFRLINPVLFSWWLKPILERWVRNGFAKDIKQAFPTLFELHGGKVVSDPMPKTNDGRMDYVCIHCPTLIFKFRRWHRENYGIEVAPTFAPAELVELPDVLQAVDLTTSIDNSLRDVSWHFWGKLLEPRFQLLEHAFSAERYQDTKRRLANRC